MRKIEVGHQVQVARDIFRIADVNGTRTRILYAKEGETGVVVETFKTVPYRNGSALVWHAKVRMGGPTSPLKTFRVTSLTRLT